MRMKEDDDALQASIKRLERASNGVECPALEAITFRGIRVVEARTGFLRCYFVVPIRAAYQDGNWEVGAIATLIDAFGAITINSFTGNAKASVDLTISFYSAKIQEEVEIEANVVGSRGKLTSVLVEVKRKGNGELIALGKNWITSKLQVSCLEIAKPSNFDPFSVIMKCRCCHFEHPIFIVLAFIS